MGFDNRMNRFIMKKREDQLKKQIECLEKDLAKKENIIFKLEVKISNLKFTSIKPRPKLSIRNVANQNIPAILPSTKPNLKKLSIMHVASHDIPPAPPSYYQNHTYSMR